MISPLSIVAVDSEVEALEVGGGGLALLAGLDLGCGLLLGDGGVDLADGLVLKEDVVGLLERGLLLGGDRRRGDEGGVLEADGVAVCNLQKAGRL